MDVGQYLIYSVADCQAKLVSHFITSYGNNGKLWACFYVAFFICLASFTSTLVEPLEIAYCSFNKISILPNSSHFAKHSLINNYIKRTAEYVNNLITKYYIGGSTFEDDQISWGS